MVSGPYLYYVAQIRCYLFAVECVTIQIIIVEINYKMIYIGRLVIVGKI